MKILPLSYAGYLIVDALKIIDYDRKDDESQFNRLQHNRLYNTTVNQNQYRYQIDFGNPGPIH